MRVTQPKKIRFDVADSVEYVCELGCTRVNEIIRTVQAGGRPAELAHLGSTERTAVVDELASIMSVYQRDC